MRTLILFKGMLRRQIIEAYRYSFELISTFALMYLVFVLLFFGARALIGTEPQTGETLSAIVVGYLVWGLAVMTYGATAGDATEEATAGTLEQLAMSPFGLARVLTVKYVANFAVTSWIFATLLLLMMATSGRWLHVDLFSILPLVILTLAGVFGVGLVLGGLAIVFKRVQSALQIFQFAFVALVAVPIEQAPVVKYLPLAWGNHLLQRVMVDELSILQIPAADLGFLAVHAAAWLAVGYAAFAVLETAARQRALLGHY